MDKRDNSKIYFKSVIKAKAVSFAQPDYSAIFTTMAPPTAKAKQPKKLLAFAKLVFEYFY